jgi:drug/metabolite transporter (DMT)-like permease
VEPRPAAVVPVLIAGLIAFASSPILVRLAGDVPPASVIALRTLLAAVLLLPLWPRVLGETRDLLDAAGWGRLLLGGVFLALHFAAWIESLAFTSVASASVLVSTSPLFLALVAHFVLRERLSRVTWAAVGAGMTGAALIGIGDAGATQAGRLPVLGNALAVSAAGVFSLYLLVGGRVRQRLSWAGFVVPIYTTVAVLLVAYAAARGVLGVGWTPRVFVLCALMALGPQLVGHGAFGYALRYVSPVLLGLLSLIEPIGGSFAAYLLFNEQPTPLAFAGMGVTLLAVAGALLGPRLQARNAARKASAGRS